MKKRQKLFAILAASCVALALLGWTAWKMGALFPLTDAVTRVFLASPPERCDVRTRPYSQEALAQDSRVTFHQAGMLINKTHLLPADFEAEIGQYKDTGVLMNRAMLESYAQLSQQVSQRFDRKLYVRSSYRTAAQQQQILLEEGETATAVGASEHQAGLALDVYVKSFAGKAFLKSPAGRWVNAHSWEYGFIIRYPFTPRNEDGIGYEPWHLRYVGQPHAEIIYRNTMTLESYFELLSVGQWWQYGDYLISRQSGDTLQLPESFSAVTVSPDNTGGWLVTVHLEQ